MSLKLFALIIDFVKAFQDFSWNCKPSTRGKVVAMKWGQVAAGFWFDFLYVILRCKETLPSKRAPDSGTRKKTSLGWCYPSPPVLIQTPCISFQAVVTITLCHNHSETPALTAEIRFYSVSHIFYKAPVMNNCETNRISTSDSWLCGNQNQ